MIPVGVRDPRIIPDNQMKASSECYAGRCKAAYGRLYDMRGDGWCSFFLHNSTTDWLQVDLGKTLQVCAVATQGDVDSDEWTRVFKLSYSSDEKNWTVYKDINGTDMVRTCQVIKENTVVKFDPVGLKTSLECCRHPNQKEKRLKRTTKENDNLIEAEFLEKYSL